MSIEIKICGITNRDDALYALEAGADYLGFVVYRHSPRGITAMQAAKLLDSIDLPCRAVGVFVNMPTDDINTLAGDTGLAAAQLHGDEMPEDAQALCLPAWRALRVGDGSCSPDPGDWDVDRFILDANQPGRYGGTGQCADWDKAKELASRHCCMLAGGLTPDNVREAINRVRPAGVDVSGGVERAPGRKDREKVRQFILSARESAAT